MIIYLVGISCVGKTTIGRMLAEKIGFTFYDLDDEVESYYEAPIEVIQKECFSMNGFRAKASVVLDSLFNQEGNLVVAGTPSGLRNSYLRVYKKYKKVKEIYSVHLVDTPENILKRVVFFDEDSNPMEIELTESLKKKYLIKIRGDFNYFKKSLERATIQVNIENIRIELIPDLIIEAIRSYNINFEKIQPISILSSGYQ